ncbi:MAG: hypothetical protein JNM17_28285 [Archangium sp.]|nr:hypothetical protein [Archangium sp.]
MRHWMLCGVLLSSGVAGAQVKPPVAAYPLDVLVRGVSPQQVKELQSETRRLLAAEAATPDALTLDTALLMTERKDCDVEDACLKQFALNAKVLYALFASVETDLTQKQVTASGRVVRDDGTLVVPVKKVTVQRKGKEPIDAALREALKALYAEIKLSALPATREQPVVKKDPDPVIIKKDPDLPPPPPPLIDTGAGQRAAGVALLIGGSAVVAGGVALSAAGCGFGCSVTPGNPGMSIPEGQLGNATTGRSLMTVGFVGVGAGAAVAVVGAIVLATAPAAPVRSVSVVPVAGGAVLQMGGEF